MTNNTNTRTPAADAQPGAATRSGQIERGTDAAASWKPATDSSASWQTAAKTDGTLHLELSDERCLCGCAQRAESRFRPGHDATLKGKLTRAALHDAKLTLHFSETQIAVVEPRQLAVKLSSEKHDWAVALDRSVERARKAAEEAAKRRAEAKAKREAAAKERGESTKLSFADFAA